MPVAAWPAGVQLLERGWLSSNSVLLTGANGTALVDCGYWTHIDQTLALVRQSLRGRPLDRLLNTHLHSDHCGGNAALQTAYPGLRTLIPPGQAAFVTPWDPVALSYEPTGQHCPPFTFDGVLLPGSVVQLGDGHWQVHAAPGHDPHSIVLFEPDTRTLISADALWENGFGVVFQELEGEHAFDAVAATLDLIEALQPNLVLPGHGAAFSQVDLALARSRSRLAAYLKDPRRHAVHAAKVLLKFKLLELQTEHRPAFLQWAQRTRYFEMVHTRWFVEQRLCDWLEQLLEALAEAGALELLGDLVINR